MKKPRWTLLRFTLILAILLAAMSVTALASGAPEADAEYETASGWETGSIADAFSKVKDGGSIKLLGDVTLSENLTLSETKSVTLLGEGCKLSVTSIILSGSFKLTLGAEDYDKTLVISSHSDTQCIISCDSDTVLTMYDNVTLGPSRAGGQTGGVHLSDRAVFYMYGGRITECENWASISGAISLANESVFYMYDGLIDNCTGVRGGAISVTPQFPIGGSSVGPASVNIYGGTIKNCSDTTSGGAIRINSSYDVTINISGLSIIDCSTTGYGGAIYVNLSNKDAKVNISDTEITGCSASKYGGAIYVYLPSEGAKVNISDTEITGCSADQYGGGIFLYHGDLALGSDVSVHNNSAKLAGDDLYFHATVPSSFYDPPSGLTLSTTGRDIEGWHVDGLTVGESTPRWTLGGEGVEPYIMPIAAQDVESGTALKAAHGDKVSYTIEVSVNDPDYGTAYADLTSAEAGTTISLTATPNDGYSFAGWQVVSGGIQITDNKFIMPEENVKITAVFEKELPPYIPPITTPETPTEPSEPDYTPNWLNTTDHVSYIIGYSDGTVKPNAGITRAEVATIFFRLLTNGARERFWSESNAYSDVAAGSWYNIAVSTLSNMGILGGYEDGTFRPNASITRAEFAKIAVSFFDWADVYAVNSFVDVRDSAWYANYVAVAAEIGLIEGYGGNVFRPDATITRAEACTIINRTLGRAPDADHLLPVAQMNTWPDNADTGVWYYAQIQEATNSHDYRWLGDIEQWTAKLADPDWDKLQY